VTPENRSEETPAPPGEFVKFIRKIGVEAFDRFADSLPPRSGSLRKLASGWHALTPAEKAQFFDYLIAGGVMIAAAAATRVKRSAKAKATKAPRKKSKKAVTPA
jgi:hypothetical protein